MAATSSVRLTGWGDDSLASDSGLKTPSPGWYGRRRWRCASASRRGRVRRGAGLAMILPAPSYCRSWRLNIDMHEQVLSVSESSWPAGCRTGSPVSRRAVV